MNFDGSTVTKVRHLREMPVVLGIYLPKLELIKLDSLLQARRVQHVISSFYNKRRSLGEYRFVHKDCFTNTMQA